MKKLLILTFLIFSMSSYSQELNSSRANKFPAVENFEFTKPEDVFIGPWEVQRPSLSLPVRELPENSFTIREADFSKKQEKRQVNLIAMMEKERYRKEEALVEMESPALTLGTGEKALIEVTNEIRRFDRSSNFDIYTGKKKIPAYQEMQTPLFRNTFSPYSGRRSGSPGFYYSPYLR